MSSVFGLLEQSGLFHDQSILYGLRGVVKRQDHVHEYLELVAESDCPEIIDLCQSYFLRMVKEGKRDEIVRAGSLNAILLCISKHQPVVFPKALELIITSILDARELDKDQIQIIINVVGAVLEKTGDKAILEKLLTIFNRLLIHESFSLMFIHSIQQEKLGRFFNADALIRLEFIKCLTKIVQQTKTTEFIQQGLISTLMTNFSSEAHGEDVKVWLSLFSEVLISAKFAKEFVRRGGLRIMLTMLRIPHINIVFLVIRVLKAIKKHGLIDTPEFANATRQQLIKFISDHQERLNKPSTTKSVVNREAIKILDSATTVKTIHVPVVVPKEIPKHVPPQAEPSTSRKVTPKKTKKSVQPLAPKAQAKEDKKVDLKKSISLLAVKKEEEESDESFADTWVLEIEQGLQRLAESDLDTKLDILRKIQRLMSHDKVPIGLCESICDKVGCLLLLDDSRIYIECCTIFHLLSYQEELHELLESKNIIRIMIDVINGYNLERIEYSLWVIEKYCCNEHNMMIVFRHGIIPALGVVMNSGIEHIRLYSQFILKRMAKIENEDLLTELKNILASNPWYKVSKTWNEMLPWSPVGYIDQQNASMTL